MDKILDVFELYADTDKRKIEKFNEKLSSKMTVRIESDKPHMESEWIEKMEDTLEYLDNILRAPTRLIVNEEEVVKIEKIKKVTVESIKHLAKNAGFIEEVEDDGEVKPGKLLNVFKEETFNTYENRFIYTLIQKMLTIIRKEKKKLIEQNKQTSKEYKTIHIIFLVLVNKLLPLSEFTKTNERPRLSLNSLLIFDQPQKSPIVISATLLRFVNGQL